MTCTRRRFLSLSAGALGLAARPLRAQQAERKTVRGVIWLWMDGSVPPVQTWDPQPNSGIKEIGTSLEGIQICEPLPLCAAQMHHLSIIRTVSHGAGDHEVASRVMHVGQLVSGDRDLAPIGTILAFELGTKDHPLPKHLTMGPVPLIPTAHFDEEFQPFALNASPLNPIPNLRRNVDRTRDEERAALLLEQNQVWGGLHQQSAVRKLGSATIQADRVMNTPLLKAFNVQDEPAALRTAYGEGFGLQCLLARRLVEAGCPFVEVGLGGWKWRYRSVAPVLDHGFGTLIADLASKGLMREVLVVCATEFGRRHFPQFQGDAQPERFSVVLAGGGLAGGRTVDKTPVPVKDLFATIYAACDLDWTKTYSDGGRKIKYSDGKLVAELF